MKIKDEITLMFNELVHTALKYQLAITGKFLLSQDTSQTELNNKELNQFGIHFTSSHRLDFDGGIQLNLLAIDQLGAEMLKSKGNNFIKGDIYNLESTDCETDLEFFILKLTMIAIWYRSVLI